MLAREEEMLIFEPKRAVEAVMPPDPTPPAQPPGPGPDPDPPPAPGPAPDPVPIEPGLPTYEDVPPVKPIDG
jgi:hypothetical protein